MMLQSFLDAFERANLSENKSGLAPKFFGLGNVPGFGQVFYYRVLAWDLYLGFSQCFFYLGLARVPCLLLARAS